MTALGKAAKLLGEARKVLTSAGYDDWDGTLSMLTEEIVLEDLNSEEGDDDDGKDSFSQ